MSCGVVRRQGSDPELLWLWCRPVAPAPIKPLAWKLPYVPSAALEKTKKKKKKKKKIKNSLVHTWLLFFVLFIFLGPHLRHVEGPRLGAELVLQLPATATVTAIQDLSLVCDLHSSSWQHRIPGPLSEGREWTCILTDICWICFCWATMGTPSILWFYWFPLKLVQVRSR